MQSFELSLILKEKNEFSKEITPCKAVPWNVAIDVIGQSIGFYMKRGSKCTVLAKPISTLLP